MPLPPAHRIGSAFHTPVLRRLWIYILLVVVYTAAVYAVAQHFPDIQEHLPAKSGVEAVVTGILFGWLMSFRTTTAYARWWEGRGVWGQLINECRNLHIRGARLLQATPAAAAHLSAQLLRFAEALRAHLTSGGPAGGRHEPMAVASDVFVILADAHASGQLDGFAFRILDDHAKKLMDICGACERLKNTPFIPSYRGLLRGGTAFYVLAIPWLLVDELGVWLIPIVGAIAYALIGLELIASSIESPFGSDGDDLPLDDLVAALARTIAAG